MTSGNGTSGSTLPLDNVTVVDLTHMAAGPYCTTLLGDLGANVIKVEAPGRGDGLRYTDRTYPGEDGSYFLGINRNKRSLALDLKNPSQRDALLRIAEQADVFIENFRPGAVDRLGLAYDDIKGVRPDIVYASIYAFGSESPLRDKPGMDLVIQGMSGVMGLTGHDVNSPVRIAASIADYSGGLYACQSILAALVRRFATGAGSHLEISLLDSLTSLLSNYVPAWFVTGEPSRPVGNSHPQLVPYQVFRTEDSNLIVACLTQGFWRSLCLDLGLERLIEDPLYVRNADRLENRDSLIDLLSERFRTETTAYWVKRLDASGVPNAPVNGLGEALTQEDVVARGSIGRYTHPVAGSVPFIRNPVLWDGARLEARTPAPVLGEHSAEILADFGFGEDEIDALTDAGRGAGSEEGNGT